MLQPTSHMTFATKINFATRRVLPLTIAIAMLAFLPLKWLLLLITAASAMILLLRWPWMIWLVLAALLPFISAIKWGALSLADVGLAGAAMLWFADGVRQRTLRLTWSPLLTALLLYIVALLASTLNATNLGEAAAEVVKWVEVLLLVLLVEQMVPARQSGWLVAALLVGGVAQSLLGLYQFFYQIGPAWFIILGRFMRASGSFGQPNPFAGYLGLTLPVAVSISIWALVTMRRHWAGHQRGRHLLLLLLSIGAAAVMGMALLASWSRGGWLGAAAAIAVVLGARSRKSIITGVILLLLLLSVLLVDSTLSLASTGAETSGQIRSSSSVEPDVLSARFANVSTFFGLNRGGIEAALKQPVNDDNFAIIERLAHWSAALHMWRQAPWLGVGPGNYAVVYPAIIQQHTSLMRWQEPLGHAHNIYLNVLAESGVIGLAAYLLFWTMVILWLWRQSGHAGWLAKASWNQALTLGVIGVVVHLSVHNMVDNVFVQGNYLLIGFWIALVNLPKLYSGSA